MRLPPPTEAGMPDLSGNQPPLSELERDAWPWRRASQGSDSLESEGSRMGAANIFGSRAEGLGASAEVLPSA